MQFNKSTPYSMVALVFAASLAILWRPVATYGQQPAASAKTKITFDQHVQPILRQHCSTCHNADRSSGDLDVTNYSSLMEGGSSGTVIEPGDHDSSYLFLLVNHDDQPQMPPSGQKIPADAIKTLANWIDAGALENASSKAKLKKKKGLSELSVAANPTAKPDVVPLPARTVLESDLQLHRPPAASAIATSPWAPIVAIGGPGQVLLYHTQTARLAGVIPFSAGQVHSLRFSRNGQLIAIGGGTPGTSGKVLIWNLITAQPVTWIGNELDVILACDISPDQSMVAIGGPSKTAKVYSTQTGELLFRLEKHTNWVTAVQFSPDNALLVTGDRDGGLQTWEAITGRHYMTLKGHTEMITSVSWRTDSNLIASSSEDDTARLWELTAGRQIKSWKAHPPGVLSVQFTADGRLVSSGRDKTVKLWDGQGKLIRAFKPLPDIATHAAICDTTGSVIASAYDGQVFMGAATQDSLTQPLPTVVKPLSEQLASAEQRLNRQKPLFNAARTKFENIQQNHDQLLASLDSLNQQRTSVMQELTQLRSNANSCNEQVAEIEQRQTTVESSINEIGSVLPLVEESLAKIELAISKAPQNNDLKQSATLLTQQVTKLQTDLANFDQESQGITQRLNETSQTLSTIDGQIQATQSQIDSLDQKITAATGQLDDAKRRRQTAQTEFDGRKKIQQKAASDVDFWKAEIAFKAKLFDLQNKLAAAAKSQAEHQQAFAQAQQQLKQAQAAAATAQHHLDNANRTTTAIDADIRKLRQAR